MSTPSIDSDGFAVPVPPSSSSSSSSVDSSDFFSQFSSSNLDEIPADQIVQLRRQKVPLRPGFSHFNWLTYLNSVRRPPAAFSQYSLEEISSHNTFRDLWIILNGRVYDISKYSPYHPGGLKTLLMVAGRDGTKLFNQIHSFVNIEALIGKFCIGTVALNSETKKKSEEENGENEENNDEESEAK